MGELVIKFMHGGDFKAREISKYHKYDLGSFPQPDTITTSIERPTWKVLDNTTKYKNYWTKFITQYVNFLR